MTNPPAATQTETQPPKRVKKRIYIPLVLLVLLLLIAVGFWIRGTWADTSEKDPAVLETGTVTQLLKLPDGNVVVRCAIAVDAPPSAVWATIKDYASHDKFLPYVSKVVSTEQDDGQFLIDGVAHSRLWGDWAFQSRVTHKEQPDKGEYSALWSEEDVAVFKVNRGGWSVKPINKNTQTLLVFTLQIELKDYPNFIVRNIIMDRLYTALTAMRDETLRRKTKA